MIFLTVGCIEANVTYFLELLERLEASLHFGDYAEHCCEPAHWIYTRGGIHYGLFQPRLVLSLPRIVGQKADP